MRARAGRRGVGGGPHRAAVAGLYCSTNQSGCRGHASAAAEGYTPRANLSTWKPPNTLAYQISPRSGLITGRAAAMSTVASVALSVPVLKYAISLAFIGLRMS